VRPAHRHQWDSCRFLCVVVVIGRRRARVRAVHGVVGELPPREIRGLAGPKVRVTGSVSSVTPHVARAAVIAAPLRLGGGMRVEGVEALAAGKPIVASALAAEGLNVRHGE
jgi:hypothetical protein